MDRQPAQQQVQRAAKSGPQPAKAIATDTRQLARPVLNTAEHTANDAQKQLSETTQPVLNTARQPTNDVQKQLNEATQPVLNTAEQTANDVQEQLSEATQPVLKDARDQLNQTTQPILNTAEQTLASENQPAGHTLDSVEQTQPPAQQTSQPVATPVQQQVPAPVLHEETSLPVAPALEGSAVQSDSRSLLPQAMDALASRSATSSSAPEASKSASFDLSGFTSTTLESLESSSVQPLAERKQAAPASTSEHSVVFDSGGAQSISIRVPQPSPAGAIPGSLSAGSGSIFGGSGFGLGILAFLTILLLGGGLLRSSRDFLAPDSALHLILERPG